MEQIINQLINSFDFSLMLILNILTYAMIKVWDSVNGDKPVTTWNKRVCYIFVVVLAGVCYQYLADIPIRIFINSCIAAPVAWSWLYKPIANKLGIDYKHKS